MLLYFKTSNSRSFDEEVTFSMIAADYGGILPNNLIYIQKYNIHVVKTALIYGANASGKSNLLKSIEDALIIIDGSFNQNYGKELVLFLEEKNQKFPFYPNKNKTANLKKPTTYTLGFYIKDNCYEYSFSVDGSSVHSESLTYISNTSDNILLFERKLISNGSQKYKWNFNSDFFEETFQSVTKSLTKEYNLWLSTVFQFSSDDSEYRNNTIDELIFFFSTVLVQPWINKENPGKISHEHTINAIIRFSPKFKKSLIAQIKEGDLLINDIKVEEDRNSGKQTIVVSHKGLDHNNKIIDIDFDFFDEESAGTQQFIAWLYPLSLFYTNGCIAIIDELGNSLHTLLTRYLISQFQKKNSQGQLIFTTHDVKLMDRDLLRLDQIWLANRDQWGNSTLEPLSNYDIPEDMMLDNIYLQGTLQGIPKFKKAKMLTPRPKAFKIPADNSILIVCEDSKSSVFYLEDKLKACKIPDSVQLEKKYKKKPLVAELVVDVDGKSDSAPTSVVEYAIEKRDKYNSEAKKKGIFPYKSVYCVIDVDNHNDNDNNLDKAIAKIKEDKTVLAKHKLPGELIPIISNECFELWYVLHFIEYSTKALHRPRKGLQLQDNQRLDKILEMYLGKDYDKGDKTILQLIQDSGGQEEKAIINSKKIIEFHITNLDLERDELAYYNNPSTKVHQLIELLNRIQERQEANEATDFKIITLEDVRQKIDRHSTDRVKLLFTDKNDKFLLEITALINNIYKEDTQSRKIDLMLDLFNNPESNTLCSEYPEKIGAIFYAGYYRWKDSIEKE